MTVVDTRNGPALSLAGVTKIYGVRGTEVRALDGVDVSFARGRFTAIMGPSGSGKSTLMHCAAGLDSVTSGSVQLFDGDGRGTRLDTLGDTAATRLRRTRIGFVFQSFNLLPTLTARQNITLPLELAGRRADPAWFDTLVEVLGLDDRLSHLPSQLSGGQQQRVACARALLPRPDVIFADEPTGNLDSRTSHEVLAFLRRSVNELDQTVVMVTHHPAAAATADRVVVLADGRIVEDLDAPCPADIFDALAREGA